MPKTSAYIRSNNTIQIVDKHAQWLNQSVTTFDDVLFNTLNTVSDVIIGGNLTVGGATTIISGEIVEIKDNIILVNAEETGSGVTLNLAGLEIDRGLLPNFKAVYEESSQLYKIGEIGDLQAVATRDDAPLDKGVMVYDSSSGKLQSVTAISLPITFDSGVNPTDSQSGAVSITGGGGLGVSGDIRADGRIFIGDNFCRSDNDNFEVNSLGDFSFEQVPGSNINIPDNVNVNLGGKRIFSSTTNITIENTLGNIRLSSGSSIVLPVNTYLQWDSGNRMRYNGTTLSLDSSGSFVVTNTGSSLSSTSGGLVTLGGIGVSKNTNAVSATNGGAFTVAGGGGIGKRFFVGDQINTGTNNLSIIHAPGEGVNFRSINRVLTTSSTNDITFNSFEGGQVVSPGITNATTLSVSPPSGDFINGFSLQVHSGVSKFNDTTPSTGVESGAVVISGGVGISGDTESMSPGNGGALTVRGGAGFGKKVFIGDQLVTGYSDLSVNQIQNQGVNFRSTSRVLTTTSNTDFIINSFEGSTINTGSSLTNSANVYISGPPSIVGGTVLNNYSLWVNSGKSKFDGDVDVSGVLQTSGGIGISDDTPSTSTTTGALVIVGGVGIGEKVFIGDDLVCEKEIKLADDFSFGIENGNLFISSITDTVFTISQASGVAEFSSGLIVDETLNVSGTTESVSSNSGALRVVGGVGIGKSLVVGGDTSLQNLKVFDGLTVEGQLGISVDTVGDSVIDSDSGVSLISGSGTVNVNGFNGIILDSSGPLVTSVSGNSNITTVSGSMTMSADDLILQGTVSVNIASPEIVLASDNNLDIQAVSSIQIGRSSSVDVFIGHPSSEVQIGNNLTIGGNLTILGEMTSVESTTVTIADNSIVVNALPVGISDGGYMVRRYQTPNDTGTGSVVNDTFTESSTFQGGSNETTLILNSSSSSVDDYYNGWWIKFNNIVRRIKDYNGSTKEAFIFTSSDDGGDGLDIQTSDVPLSSDTYTLYGCSYAGIYYSENNKEFRVACIPFDISSGTFSEPVSYTPIHVDSIIVENGITSSGDLTSGKLTVNYNGQDALTVKNSNGDVFKVDTENGVITVSNNVNTINSDTTISFNQNDNLNQTQTYSQINNVLLNNLNGALSSQLEFLIQDNGLISGLTLSKNTEFGSLIDSVSLLNTTSSTSPSTGVLRVAGGVGISNTTDATSSTNGGSFTTGGGLAVGKNTYVGGKIICESVSEVLETSNDVTQGGSMVVSGDAVVYSKLFFDATGVSPPTTVSRSEGTKIVLSPNISATTVDYALGIDTGGVLWYSSENSHDFYLGTELIVQIDDTGITTQGVSFNNENFRIYAENGLRVVAEDPGVVFRDSLDTVDRISINGDGRMNIGLSGYSGAPLGGSGDVFNVSGVVFTDTETITDTPAMIFNAFGQPTLASSNMITTTGVSSVFLGGPPVKGQNQAFDNVYNLHIGQGASVSSSGTIENGASVFIEGAPLGTITNKYSLWVNSGQSRFDGVITVSDSSKVGNASVINGTQGSLNTRGDITLYDPDKNTIVFRENAGSSPPENTTRSSGTKIVLLPDTGVDYAIGVEPGSIWYTSEKHKFYLGTESRFEIDTIGCLFNTSGNEINLRLSENNKSMIINGGQDTVSGAYLELQGNDFQSSDAVVSSGVNGSIRLQDGGNQDRLVMLTTGQIEIKSEEDTTGINSGSLRVKGGASIDKKLSIHSTQSSGNSTEGALQIAGSIAISSTYNALSSTNGGTFTTAGGGAFGKDVYIGGNLNVAGNVQIGVSTPVLVISNTENIDGTVSVHTNRVIANGGERTFSCAFSFDCITVGDTVSFEFTVPDVTSFDFKYDIVLSVNGYFQEINLENVTGFAIPGTSRCKIKCTAGNLLEKHVVQVIARYNI